jgi:ABC-type polar amino acid transport system ATPase subunit
VTCLIEPSGSGKSTLHRCTNHLEKHSGELPSRRTTRWI